MTRYGKLIGASLGPGDPELITRRSWAVLQSGARWLYPVKKAEESSYALSIVERGGIAVPADAEELVFPMTRDPVALANLMDRLRPMTDKPMIVKLTPNVTDITVPARAAVEHGADALSMINTLKGMRINIRTGKPIIANVTGGVSGPAVLPVGLAAVYRVRTALPEIPIIGLGGIDSGEKALEYLYAGANAVEVGAAALFDPVAPLRVARELDDLLDSRPELAAKLAAGQTWR